MTLLTTLQLNLESLIPDFVVGVEGRGLVSVPLVVIWDLVNDAQGANWAPTDDTQAGAWTPVNDASTVVWTEIAT